MFQLFGKQKKLQQPTQTRASKPPLNSPVIDQKTGCFTYVWQAWFDQLSQDAAAVSGVNSVIAGINSSYGNVTYDSSSNMITIPGSNPGGGYQPVSPLMLPASQGATGLQGLGNFVDQVEYPSDFVKPEFLYSESDQALFVGVQGSEHWVQCSAGSVAGNPGAEGSTGLQGLTGIQGLTGLQGPAGSGGSTTGGIQYTPVQTITINSGSITFDPTEYGSLVWLPDADDGNLTVTMASASEGLTVLVKNLAEHNRVVIGDGSLLSGIKLAVYLNGRWDFNA
jgi:hypothetical protein